MVKRETLGYDPGLIDDLVEHVTTTRASVREIDFTDVPDVFMHRDPTKKNWDQPRPRDVKGRLLTPERIKARQKTFAKKIENVEYGLDYKPIEDWDMEELARGRPRNAIGTFSGSAPAFVTRAVHEASIERFKSLVKSDMNAHAITALSTLGHILEDAELDDNGKPIVSASTKADVAKFLIEHIVGKPTQRVESDISVKLQGILGTVMVSSDNFNGNKAGRMKLAHLPGVTMPMAEAKEDDPDLFIDAE